MGSPNKPGDPVKYSHWTAQGHYQYFWHRRKPSKTCWDEPPLREPAEYPPLRFHTRQRFDIVVRKQVPAGIQYHNQPLLREKTASTRIHFTSVAVVIPLGRSSSMSSLFWKLSFPSVPPKKVANKITVTKPWRNQFYQKIIQITKPPVNNNKFSGKTTTTKEFLRNS